MSPKHSSQSMIGHMALYGVVLLAVSFLISQVVPYAAMSAVGNMFGEEPGKAAPILILMFLNIHHYFTDGVIWKISNPEVRKELFAHVPRTAKAGVDARPSQKPSSGKQQTARR